MVRLGQRLLASGPRCHGQGEDVRCQDQGVLHRVKMLRSNVRVKGQGGNVDVQSIGSRCSRQGCSGQQSRSRVKVFQDLSCDGQTLGSSCSRHVCKGQLLRLMVEVFKARLFQSDDKVRGQGITACL